MQDNDPGTSDPGDKVSPLVPSRKSTISYFLTWVTVALSILPLIALVVSSFSQFQSPKPRSGITASVEFVDRSRELESLRNRISKLESDIGALANIPTHAKVAVQLKSIQTSLDSTSAEVAALDKAIMQSPAKALEVPLLRRDMDNMKESDQANFASMKDDLNRVYSLGEWFIGLMATMAIGMLSLAITNFLSKPKKETE